MRAHKSESETPMAVYRLDGATGNMRIVADDIAGAERALLLPRTRASSTSSSRAASRPARFSLTMWAGDGALSGRRVAIDAGPGGTPDGMRADIDGQSLVRAGAWVRPSSTA